MYLPVWRFLAGPLITAASAGTMLVLEHMGVSIQLPAPGAILLATILLSTHIGGARAGYMSAAVAVIAGSVYLSETGEFLTYTPDRLFRLQLLALVALVAPAAVGVLRARAMHAVEIERNARERVEAVNQELLILRAALDRVDSGGLLLDRDLRVQFANRAFLKMWDIEKADLDGRQSFVDLIHQAGMYSADLNGFINRHVIMVEAAEETPLDLKLPEGHIIRCQCKLLPGGGRFVSYTDVTDLVRHAEELERLATTDDMTGLYNRRHFLALAEDHWHDQPLALVMLDIDLFKSINDRFGHAIGDAVIDHVAHVGLAEKRDGDVLARIGGEEFVLLMPQTSLERAATLAERIRQRLDSETFMIDGQGLRVTISLGIAEASPEMTGIGDLLRRADQALYEAKRSGRNRIKCADPSRREKPAASVAAA